jgi:hypothetical protein
MRQILKLLNALGVRVLLQPVQTPKPRAPRSTTEW